MQYQSRGSQVQGAEGPMESGQLWLDIRAFGDKSPLLTYCRLKDPPYIFIILSTLFLLVSAHINKNICKINSKKVKRVQQHRQSDPLEGHFFFPLPPGLVSCPV